MRLRDRTPASYYICNPNKNVNCKKTNCYFLNKGRCFLTSNANYSDQDIAHPLEMDEGWSTTPELRELKRIYRKEMAEGEQTIQHRQEADGELSEGAE